MSFVVVMIPSKPLLQATDKFIDLWHCKLNNSTFRSEVRFWNSDHMTETIKFLPRRSSKSVFYSWFVYSYLKGLVFAMRTILKPFWDLLDKICGILKTFLSLIVYSMKEIYFAWNVFVYVVSYPRSSLRYNFNLSFSPAVVLV